MASPQDAVVFPFIVTQPFDIDGIFGMRVSIQIMSSESFQQEIMTQELWGPREHSWNEDFQVEKSKVSLRICGLLISPFLSPLWLWDCCCCLVTESSPTLFDPMDWTCQISLSLTISWSLPKFDYGIASKKWISLRIKASFSNSPTAVVELLCEPKIRSPDLQDKSKFFFFFPFRFYNLGHRG